MKKASKLVTIVAGVVFSIVPLFSGCDGVTIMTNAGPKELENLDNIKLVQARAEELVEYGVLNNDYKSLANAFELYEKRLKGQPGSCEQMKYIAIRVLNSKEAVSGGAFLKKYEKVCCKGSNCD